MPTVAGNVRPRYSVAGVPLSSSFGNSPDKWYPLCVTLTSFCDAQVGFVAGNVGTLHLAVIGTRT